ncbi:MAG: T9SS type A sorting domain-containing protein [Crocinitomicaceae bacterium]|nr:T9SS type A sorting domain-containing protein [Crocinitomicaceae bacterium]
MKKILAIVLGMSSLSMAQTADVVTLGAGYANESYYSFENGEVASEQIDSWDLAFDLDAFGAAVRLNNKRSSLWVYPGVVGDWTTVDTNGMATTWETALNDYESWSLGALNVVGDPMSATDLGWGEYNTITHQIQGSRIFVLELSNGTFRKLLIESLAGGDYSIKFDLLDNSNEVVEVISKSSYVGKNFVYYNILTESITDREPLSSDWDVVFTNYVLELAPGYISSVTGVLQNSSVEVSKVESQPVSTSTYATFEPEINTIGYDWKSFNMSLFTYEIVADLSYFVKLENDDVWKVVFTGFEGSSTGVVNFTKEKVESAGVPEYMGATVDVYPNPASNILNISSVYSINSLSIVNASGQVVYTGVESMINVSNFDEGFYFMHIKDDAGNVSVEKIIIKH